MSEAFDNVVSDQSAPPAISHRRILWTMGTIVVVGSAAASAFVSWQFGLGVLIGGALSFVNYYWLKTSLKRIFDKATAHGDKPRFLALRYFGRYATLGAILAIVFLTHTIPVVAVILGLSAFALAIVIEGLIRLFSSFFNGREI